MNKVSGPGGSPPGPFLYAQDLFNRRGGPTGGASLTEDLSSAAKIRPAWRSDRVFLLVVVLAVLAITTVDIFTVFHDRALAGRPAPLWEPTVWEFTSGLVLLLLAPALMGLTRRHPPQPPPAFAWLAWHVPGALVFSLVHVLAMGLMRSLAYSAIGGFYAPLAPLADWPYELRKDLLTYAGLVTVYAIWRGAVPMPAGRDLGPAPIEVRDGARRLFVPVSDILWVEAAGNYVELHRDAAPVLHRAALSEMERRLAGLGFVRIHRSRLVRRDAIVAVETKSSGDFAVRLMGGQVLSGSRRFRSQALDRAASPH